MQSHAPKHDAFFMVVRLAVSSKKKLFAVSVTNGFDTI